MARPRKTAPSIGVQVLPHGAGLPLPSHQTAGAAGMDLLAAVPSEKPLKLKSGGVVLVPTGLVLEIPAGYEVQVRPRSGLAARHGITVLNAPGTIDSDYRGEVQVILINHGPKTVAIARGERIAQMVVAAVERLPLHRTTTVGKTARGAGGFGSTGIDTPPAAKPAKPKTIKAKQAPAKPAFPRRRISPARPGRF